MSCIGIVGSEAKKFNAYTEGVARELIRKAIEGYDTVSSGHCHLGGIDLWAEEIAKEMGKETLIFPPKLLQWEGGYKQRNMQIAKASDKVICITVRKLPEGYDGMRFALCYHCGTADHVKSGGCWTVKYAKKLGKPGEIWVVE